MTTFGASRSRRSSHNPGGRERRGVWIGKVRVSLGELASWQLGPDLTQTSLSAFNQRRRATDPP